MDTWITGKLRRLNQDDVVLTERDTAIFDKVMLTFDEVVSEHGYRPIPAPLYLSIEHGKLERKTDW